jgi:hypothetical protein
MDELERIQKKLIKRNGLTQEKPKKKKIDRIVKAVLFYWIIFVVVAWVTFWVKDAVPDTLIQYGLGGGAVELLITGAIEIFRDKLNREDK